jgi:hypothetical protein
MADLAITAALVLAGAAAAIDRSRVAGAAITAGQAVYLDSADRKWKLADNNSATAAVRAPHGIALNNAAANQPLAVLTEGPITIGAAVTAGIAYYLSDTPGGICPVADLASGEYPSVLGIAKSATVIDININSAGVALA